MHCDSSERLFIVHAALPVQFEAVQSITNLDRGWAAGAAMMTRMKSGEGEDRCSVRAGVSTPFVDQQSPNFLRRRPLHIFDISASSMCLPGPWQDSSCIDCTPYCIDIVGASVLEVQSSP